MTGVKFDPILGKLRMDDTVGIIDWQESVKDKDVTDPSLLTPSLGDRYIVGVGAIGAWAGQDNNIAEYNGTGWDFTTANEGMGCYVEDEDLIYIYNGSAWVSLGSVSGVTMQIAFDNGKTITNANSFANGLVVGNGTEQFVLAAYDLGLGIGTTCNFVPTSDFACFVGAPAATDPVFYVGGSNVSGVSRPQINLVSWGSGGAVAGSTSYLMINNHDAGIISHCIAGGSATKMNFYINDLNDYIQFETASDQAMINFMGCSARIKSDSGPVEFMPNGASSNYWRTQISSAIPQLEAVGTTGQIGNLSHLNFSGTFGDSGFGIRNNSGAMEFKDSGGSWNPIIALSEVDRLTSTNSTFILSDNAVNQTLTGNLGILNIVSAGNILLDPTGGNITADGNLLWNANGTRNIGADGTGVKIIWLGDDTTIAGAPLTNHRGLAFTYAGGDAYFGNDYTFPGFYGQRTVSAGSTATDNSNDYTNLYQGNSTYQQISIMYAIEDNGLNAINIGDGATDPCPLYWGTSGTTAGFKMKWDPANNKFIMTTVGVKGNTCGIFEIELNHATIQECIRPATNNKIDIGDIANTLKFRNGYFAGTLSIGVLTSAPASPANGMIAYADGTSWNPGSGQGFYGYEGGAWVKL